MKHKQSKHKGVEYSRNVCEYKTGDKSTLRRHEQSKHEGVKYSCDECDHQASTQRNLEQHQETKHEGVFYVTSVIIKPHSRKILQHANKLNKKV